MNLLRVFVGVLLASATLMLTSSPSRAQQTEPAAIVAKKMGRGVNILGYDGLWQGHLDSPFRKENFSEIYRVGFRHVRINLHAFQHMDANGVLDPWIFARLEWAFDSAIAAGLTVVVDEHDFGDCQSDVVGCARKLRSFWQQMSDHFAGKYPNVIFELLNEPGGHMTLAEWNDIQKQLIELIRIKHPHRTLIVAALNVDDQKSIYYLQLPEDDRNLIATVHYYRPFRFTHQGASWVNLDNVREDWGTEADQREVEKDLELVAVWGAETRRPIYLGEFGVYDKAPEKARMTYLSYITRLAERFGWPWAYWQFDHDFAAFNSKTQTWTPGILEALVPADPR